MLLLARVRLSLVKFRTVSVSCPLRVQSVSGPCRYRSCPRNKFQLISGRSRSPVYVVSDESQCESGCTDSECTGNLCNINFKIGHSKCYKHIKEQRGLPCNSTFPCHRCRKRLKRDTGGKFAKYLDTLSKDRKRQARKRASTNSLSNASKLTKQVDLGKYGSFMSVCFLLLLGVVDLTNWTESQVKELDNFLEEKENEIRERMKTASTQETDKMDKVSHEFFVSDITLLMNVRVQILSMLEKQANKLEELDKRTQKRKASDTPSSLKTKKSPLQKLDDLITSSSESSSDAESGWPCHARVHDFFF